MELVKNIFFNTDKLVENSKIKISYTGIFFQDDSQDVFFHYGFGNDWDNVQDVKMTKTDLGFQSEIDLCSSETFNFCFFNEKGEWDNNCGNNYVFQIEKSETSLVIREELGLETRRHLRKSYIWSKKIRLAIYKLLVYVPKLISGNYKRRLTEEE